MYIEVKPHLFLNKFSKTHTIYFVNNYSHSAQLIVYRKFFLNLLLLNKFSIVNIHSVQVYIEVLCTLYVHKNKTVPYKCVAK